MWKLWDWLRIWRVLVGLLVCQLIGDAVGRRIGLHHSAFTNSFIAAGLVAPAGFALGLLWHLASPERRRETPVGLTAFVGILTLAGTAFIIFLEIPRSKDEMARLAALQALDGESVQKIAVFDRRGNRQLKAIGDRTAIAEFAKACRDVQGYSPNHPDYTHHWYVVVIVVSGEKEFEFHFERTEPNRLVGYFVRKRGRRTSYYGSFASVQLRKWVEKHVLKSAGRT